jgi:putative FmdB family regulatory protein
MPTYEYKCNSCGHSFETVQGMNDKPLSRCPKCKSALRRVINGGMGIIFKGSGFYTTDYKKSSALTGGNGKKSESSGPSEGSSRDSSSKDSSSRDSSSRDSSSKDSKSSSGSSDSSSKEKAAAS